MQEKFCRLHSLLSRSERRRILKYSCSRPAGCLQSAPGSTPGAEQGVNGARGAGAPGQPCPALRDNSCRGNAASREQPGIIYSEAGELGSAQCQERRGAE